MYNNFRYWYIECLQFRILFCLYFLATKPSICRKFHTTIGCIFSMNYKETGHFASVIK